MHAQRAADEEGDVAASLREEILQFIRQLRAFKLLAVNAHGNHIILLADARKHFFTLAAHHGLVELF